MKPNLQAGDDIVRVRQSTLIGLYRDAAAIPRVSNAVKAQLSGGYLSSFRGRGMEFHESRPYQPGDDIRSIDWRVTARSGKTHTKIYREERERPVLLWVDLQQSMFFGTQNCFKSVLAAKLAALLAWSSVQQGDRLGGMIFAESEHSEFRPMRGKAAALHFIRKLASHPAWEQGTKPDSRQSSNSVSTQNVGAQALSRLRQVTRPGSLVVLVSDFRFFDESSRLHLTQLAKHNDVVLLFTHDPLEQQLPPSGFYRFTDGESEVSVDSTSQTSRSQYQHRFEQHHQNLLQLRNQLRISLLDISTTSNWLEILKKGFGK